jgi:hypothetical protein
MVAVSGIVQTDWTLLGAVLTLGRALDVGEDVHVFYLY